MLAFDLDAGLAAAGYITLAATLTRYADRADQIVATTIYPAICAVQDRLDVQRELFVKSSRVTMIWALPFCAALALFADDLIDGVLGAEWEPAVLLIQGLAVAAGLQQVGYGWFSLYRARNEPEVQAVESAAMVLAFLGLAVPGPVPVRGRGLRGRADRHVGGDARRAPPLPAAAVRRRGAGLAGPARRGTGPGGRGRSPWARGSCSTPAPCPSCCCSRWPPRRSRGCAERDLLRELWGYARTRGAPIGAGDPVGAATG